LIKLGYKITEKHIRLGIEHVKSNTNLLGRWHILQQAPLIVADTGHNEDGLKYVVEQIKQQKYKQLHLVIGVVKDKALNKVLPLLPKEGIYYFTKANLPRALDEKELQAEAYKFGLKGKTYFSVDEAVLAAKASADKDDFIFIGGSTFIVAEAI
jgi:dihydrofolate synthase/folylpolyglutamate synthase